jgi:hypothetical protein
MKINLSDIPHDIRRSGLPGPGMSKGERLISPGLHQKDHEADRPKIANQPISIAFDNLPQAERSRHHDRSDNVSPSASS